MMQDSDKVLSQAEIDALLSGGTTDAGPAQATQELPPPAVEPPAPAPAPAPTQGSADSLQADVARIAQRMDKLEESMGRGGSQNGDMGELERTVKQLQDNLQELSSHLQTISGGLQGTVGFAAHENFVCGTCSNKGLVAAKLTCTSCGSDNWWGWYPE